MISAIVAGLGSVFVEKGMDALGDLFTTGTEQAINKGVEFVAEKTGIDLNAKKELSDEELVKLREVNDKYKMQILEIKLANKKEDNRHEEHKRDTAHETYREKSKAADKIADTIIKFNLPIIFILVLVNVFIVDFFHENATLIAIASNVIGVAIGNLFAERQAIINFFYGSSIGSKEKDQQIVDINKMATKQI